MIFMKKIAYFSNDIAISMPETEYIDGTINVIRMPTLDASLVVSRGLLDEGETLESSIDLQMARLDKQVKNLHYTGKQPVMVGRQRDIAGFEMHSRYIRGEALVYQYQLGLLAPGTRLMVALGYSCAHEPVETDIAYWETVKASIWFPEYERSAN